MEITSEENSLPSPHSSNDVAHDTEKLDPNISDHGAEDVDPLYIMDFVQPKFTEEVEPHTIMDFVEPKFTEEVGPHTIMDFVEPKFTEEVEQHTIMDFVEPKFTEVEVRSILEVIAATGRFWHGWDLLKNLLSFQLKQVLSEYPEAQVVGDQQLSSLVEPYPELVKRLDEALQSFIEGPPFTLQRLCEILLAARSIYPNLSKLALALEKNLLVTSTLTISTDPYPSTMTNKLDEDEPEKESSAPPVHTDPVQNGVETMVHDEDEEMADAEETEEENKTINRETAEETNSGTSETSSDQSTGSEPSGDSSPSSEPESTGSEPSGDSSPSSEPLNPTT